MSERPAHGDDVASRHDAPVKMVSGELSETLETGGLERVFVREPTHRMTFHVALTAGGQVETSALRKAWLATVARHHRLRGPLSSDLRRFRTDVDDAEKRRRIEACWNEHEGSATDDTKDFVHPIAGPPVSLRLRTQGDRSVLEFAFHHAVCDGIGASRLIYETLRTLAGRPIHLTEAGSIAEESAAPEEIQKSEEPSLSITTKWKHFRVTTRGHNAKLPHHLAIGHRSGDPEHATSSEVGCRVDSRLRSFRGNPVACLTRSQTNKILDGCRRGCMPLNDLAVASAIGAVSSMLCDKSKRHVCVMNPVDRRHWKDRRKIHNHLGLAFIRREMHQAVDPRSLLDGVHEQLRYVREHDVSGEFESTLTALEKIPMAVKMLRRSGWFAPTFSLTCLSNLQFGARSGTRNREIGGDHGDPDLIGSFLHHPLYALDVAPPLPPQCSTALAIWRCGHRISLSVRTTEAESAKFWPSELLRRWSESLENYAGRELPRIPQQPSHPHP